MWAKFSARLLLSLLCLLSFSAFARETHQFSFGDKINVLSDKAFRKTRENYFEAIGNVVVTFKKDTLYGEKASLNLNDGNVEVEGNVRYISEDMTLFGSKVNYNLHTTKLSAQNAKIVSDNYTVVGKLLERHPGQIITGSEVQYSTCRDCPESWSIYGKNVHIVLGQYIRISHAYFKVNDVVVMYVPYIIFPIKKKRETGLLFPRFSLNFEKGMTYQQPWFWAISPTNDLTLTPSVYGKRGLGGEFQYRQMFGEAKWMEVNSLMSHDQVYLPGKEDENDSGRKFFRHFADYEQHFTFGHWGNHHVFFSDTKDLDIVRDFRSYTDSRLFGSEVGGGGFFEFRRPHFNVNVETYYNRNLLTPKTLDFDHSYVQEWPRINFSSTPFSLIQTSYPGLKSLSLGVDGNFIAYRQNHTVEANYIRNAKRVNAAPYLNWDIADLGPVKLKNQTRLDYQHYRFPLKDQSTFTKSGIVYETEASFEIQKVFGLAYVEKHAAEKVDLTTLEENPKLNESLTCNSCQKKLIGDLPSYESRYGQKIIERARSSYRHSQEFKLKHYYMSDQKMDGNERFAAQIEKGEGQFDYNDAIRSQEHNLSQNIFRTSLPTSNTIEIQWNNSVLRKTPKTLDSMQDWRSLRDNFSYSKVSYFNLSQGYDFAVARNTFDDGLTRLKAETGFNWDVFSLSASEYYFYKTSDNITELSASRSFSRGSAGLTFSYDSSASPVNKKAGATISFTPFDLITLDALYKYDLALRQRTDATYKLLYSPLNNCWKLELQYAQSLIDKQVSFNFYVNFNENNFKSLSNSGQAK